MKETPRYSKSIQNGTFQTICRSGGQPLNGRSFRDALKAFFPPVKKEDPLLDFYTIYNREATDYDKGYVKKYEDDLNITLLFVRHLPLTPTAI